MCESVTIWYTCMHKTEQEMHSCQNFPPSVPNAKDPRGGLCDARREWHLVKSRRMCSACRKQTRDEMRAAEPPSKDGSWKHDWARWKNWLADRIPKETEEKKVARQKKEEIERMWAEWAGCTEKS